MTALRTSAPAGQEVWLSVQEASAMLGVSPATLRRWSAAGEVEAFTTPGGHRRFALSMLRALLPHAEDAPVRLAALGESPERMVRVMRRRARSAARESAWVTALSAEDRAVLRDSSRVLTEQLVAHLDATSEGARREALRRAEDAVAQQALLALRRQGCLADLVDVFLRFRASFVRELADAAVRHGLSASEATTLLTRGGEAADRVLAALVASYGAGELTRTSVVS